jgi:hypothetical protein
LEALQNALNTGFEKRNSFKTFDAVHVNPGIQLFKDLTSTLGIPLSTAVGVWLHARYGRKVRIKIGDVEVEGQSFDEVEKGLEKAMTLQQKSQSNKIIKPLWPYG